MEGLSHITSASPVENFLPLAHPPKRKAGFPKAGIASTASIAMLAMFGPRVADADTYITYAGTISSATFSGHGTAGYIGQPFSATIHSLPYASSSCPTGYTTCYTTPTILTGETSLTIGAASQTGIYDSYVSFLNLGSPVTGGYQTLATRSGTGGDVFGTITASTLPLPDPFANPSATVTSPASGSITLYAGNIIASGPLYGIDFVGNVNSISISSTPPTYQTTGAKLIGCPGNTQGNAPCTIADPINAATGNVYETVVDYQSGGQNKLTFERFYNSLSNAVNTGTFAKTLGTNWRSNYDRYLNITSSGGAVASVAAERTDGQVLTFTPNGSGGYTSDSDVDVALTKSGTVWTLKDRNDVTETYNDLGTGKALLSSITQRNGYAQTLSYNGSNQLTTVTDSYSRSLTLTYSSGLLNTVTTPGGLILTYAYSSSGVTPGVNDQLASVSYNTSPVTSQTYSYGNTSFPFALTSVTDENGHVASTWGYDTSGRGTSSQRATVGSQQVDLTTVAYNSTGTVTVTNPLGEHTTYTFTTMQGVPKLTGISRAASTGIPAASETTGYDSNGYVNSQTDWNGNTTTYVNNTHGQPTSITEASGTAIARTTTISYDPTFVHLPHTITEPTRTTTIGYDTSGNVHTSTVADTLTSTPSRTWTYTYNGTGEVLTATGQTANGASAAQKTTLTYDTAGNLSTSTLTVDSSPSDNIVTNFNTYDADGRLKNWTDPNGLITAYTYDKRSNLLTQSVGTVGTSGGTQVTTLLRDAAENITKVTKPDSSYLSYTLDAANRPTVVTNALGEHINYTLDIAGNATAVNVYDSTSTLNRTHTYTFDALSRLKTDTDAYSNTTTYGYDNNSNRTSVSDPLSEVTSYAFDQLNRVKTVTDPVLNATNITYSTDTRNLPSLVVDPLGFHTTYAYDGFGELTTLGSQDTGTTTYTYDNAGNVKTKQDANGKTTTYTAYDSLNRIGTATYQDATTSNYYYDHNANSIGRLWQLADPTPTYPAGQPANTTYVDYDLYGNVTGKYNQLTGQTSYSTFDPNTNQLTTETYPSGMLVAYKYDAAGQMNRFDINGSWFIHNATHQPFGPVSGWTWGNGTSTAYTRTFDLDGRLTGYPLDGTNTRTVGYDGASRVTSINDSVATQSIGYDADSRITSYTGPYGNGSFSGVTYDANGNRTSIAYSSATETDTIDTVSNFLQQTKLGTAAAITYTPDAAGNTTAIGSSTTYSYDARNRQNGEVFGAYSTNWFYDGLGDRIEKYTPPPGQLFRVAFASAGTELTSTRELGSYFYGGPTYGNLTLQETIYLDHAGTAAQFGAIPVGVQPTGTTSAHPWTTARAYTDQQGSVRRLTDLSLNLYGKWDTDPFGVGQWNYSPAGFSTLYYDQRFPGQSANDAGGTNDTTSYFNTTRNYVQGTGRYMQSDSIGLAGTTPGSMSTYPYVGSNPANGIDPDGRFGPIGFVIGAGVGGVAGYATGGWRGAAVGAVTGGVVGIVAPEASAAAGGGAAGALAFAGTSAVGAGAGTVALNLWSGKPLSEGMCTSAALAATAPVLSGEALLAGGGVISESVIEGRLASTVLGINTTIFGTSGELMFSRAAPLMSPAPRPIRSDFGDRTLFPAGAPMVR